MTSADLWPYSRSAPDYNHSRRRMTQIWQMAVLAGALGLLGTCAREPRVGTPGTGCMLASCCTGWLWVMGRCTTSQPPFCGCRCEQSPRPYGSEEQCLADHPGSAPLRKVGGD